jgi:hypothetical protein
MKIISIDRPEAGTMEMPERFRKEIVYFMTPADVPGAPICGKNQYWIPLANSQEWLEDGVFSLVSPLDAESKAEIELTEDQERWLEWMVKNQVSLIEIV